MFREILENVKEVKPIVHHITNYVTVNDCANITLAIGGSPIMADDILEVEEIVSISNSLIINIGTINSISLQSMLLAGKKANKLNIPVILDPVGVGASSFRNEAIISILNEIKISVIRGNISEIKSIYMGSGSTKGVDANNFDIFFEEKIDDIVGIAQDLSYRTGAIIAISGAIDIVCDDIKTYIIKNGHEMMTKITGAGCMLTSTIGTFCGANKDNYLETCAAAVCAMGICGEKAYDKMLKEDSGSSSFSKYIIDYMSKLDSETLEGGMKIAIK